MKNQFKKMVKLFRKEDNFVALAWGTIHSSKQASRKWFFCPLAAAALQLGLNS